jgi:hypothetical protein
LTASPPIRHHAPRGFRIPTRVAKSELPLPVTDSNISEAVMMEAVVQSSTFTLRAVKDASCSLNSLTSN